MQKKLICIVDDDPSIRKAMSRLCKIASYDVETYESSEAFIAAQVVDRAGLLVLDQGIPGKSGVELQRELLLTATTCPILFASANQDKPVRDAALEAGAIEILSKPAKAEHFLQVIERAVCTTNQLSSRTSSQNGLDKS